MTSTIYVNRWRRGKKKKQKEKQTFQIAFLSINLMVTQSATLTVKKIYRKISRKTSGHTDIVAANQHSYLYEETRNQTQSHGNYSSCTLDRSRNWRSRYKDNSGFLFFFFFQEWVIRTKVDMSDESSNQSRSIIIIIKLKNMEIYVPICTRAFDFILIEC